ncbi:2-phosphoxylose phosphatase 1 [Eumeta japonica]|uniref:2-phosphoxylose phosphatase 1 n=1 Tax=Eumeta variegata TaxID=151549 RepID=A0A4C1T7Y9_EUMVA|nr:2-phosphoxylose phosphatase 1 [Eumeta japonica]
MYRYISLGEEAANMKKNLPKEYMGKGDMRFHKIIQNSCNPPDNIVRGAEGAIDSENWLLQGVLVVTRHGDRGPLTHLRGGDRLPCDSVPQSALLKSYWEFVRNASGVGAGAGVGRPPWVQAAGPFHNFPTLPVRAAGGGGTSCALGQLTPLGILQMLRVGLILSEAYAEKLNLLDSVSESSNVKRELVQMVSVLTKTGRTDRKREEDNG